MLDEANANIEKALNDSTSPDIIRRHDAPAGLISPSKSSPKGAPWWNL